MARIPNGVSIKYLCNICKTDYDNPIEAKKCFDIGVDCINLPKGLILRFQRDKPYLNYLVLETSYTLSHYTGLQWMEISSEFYIRWPSISPRDSHHSPFRSDNFRKMLHNADKCPSIRTLTEIEFQYFLDHADNIIRDINPTKLMSLYDCFQGFEYQHPELERILREN